MGKGKRPKKRSSVASVAPSASGRRALAHASVVLELLEVLDVAVTVVGGTEPEDGLALR